MLCTTLCPLSYSANVSTTTKATASISSSCMMSAENINFGVVPTVASNWQPAGAASNILL